MSASLNPSKHPNLESAVQTYLIDRNEERLRRVVESGSQLVHHFARLFSGNGPPDDLVQAGYEGLLKALRRFDPERNVKFVTYASHCIMGEIRHELRREASFDRPGWVFDLQARIHRASDKLLQRSGEPPGLEAIAEAVNIRKEGVQEALRAGSVSLDELDLSRIRRIRYESFQLPIEDRIAVRQAVEHLNGLQRRVVYLIFYQDLTQAQAARKLGISQRRVSRLLHCGLTQMAHNLA
ncbi:MAG: sigma-70 family RNA polymerase sigma factor [Clostridia bacterium]|nr:sigma-70 family RNA polymerase sigma factor [Clostridia bacterium]MDQ7791719.1 sigma-70 family RNA polymerase sigma factor [Clostridia bacterium]